MTASWSGTVVKKHRAALDGSNLYRRLKVELDDGTQMDVDVDRDTWDLLEVGERIAQRDGEAPGRP